MKQYQRRQIPFKVVENSCYIIDSFNTKTAYKLNDTSSTLWLLLEKRHNYSEIVEHFKESYDISDYQELDKDLNDLLKEMLTQSLINEI